MHAHGAAAPLVIAYAPRERTRTWVKRIAGKRTGRLALARTLKEFAEIFRTELVDAALVDIGAPDGSEQAAALAAEYRSVAFLAVTSLRVADGPALARCAELEFADVLVEGVDEGVMCDIVTRRGYSARFASALEVPPAPLSLSSALQLTAWRVLVEGGGRPIRTSTLASSLGLTREHLSRSFGSGGAPTLKRLIDLVRLLSAAELAKNPGYDVADVARVLRFSSSAHLSLTAQRLIGRRATSLAAMRGVDVIERYVKETMSRGAPTLRIRPGPARRSPGGRR
jgi:AraC-like DNA-binding protein